MIIDGKAAAARIRSDITAQVRGVRVTVIDVGVGDAAWEVARLASAMTPVPGGTGPMPWPAFLPTP